MRNRIEIQRLASNLRERLGADLYAPIDIFSLITADSDLTVVLYPFDDQVSGICFRDAGLIAINSKSTRGRQNFSLGHELYHYYVDNSGDSSISVIDTSKLEAKSSVENEADLFASHFLIPDQSLNKMVNDLTHYLDNPLKLRDVIEIEQHFKVSRHALLSRLVMDKYMKTEDAKIFREGVIINALQMGFDDSLYKSSPLGKDKQTLGSYIPRAIKLKNEGIISQGKYEELLLDAFREDLVFGEDVDDNYD